MSSRSLRPSLAGKKTPQANPSLSFQSILGLIHLHSTHDKTIQEKQSFRAFSTPAHTPLCLVSGFSEKVQNKHFRRHLADCGTPRISVVPYHGFCCLTLGNPLN